MIKKHTDSLRSLKKISIFARYVGLYCAFSHGNHHAPTRNFTYQSLGEPLRSPASEQQGNDAGYI